MSEVRERSTPPARILRHIIRKARATKKVSLERIAGIAGVDTETYDSFERGLLEIDEDALRRIVDALDIEVAREWMRVAHVKHPDSGGLPGVPVISEDVETGGLSDTLYDLGVSVEDALNRLGARRNRNYTVIDVMRFALEIYLTENGRG